MVTVHLERGIARTRDQIRKIWKWSYWLLLKMKVSWSKHTEGTLIMTWITASVVFEAPPVLAYVSKRRSFLASRSLSFFQQHQPSPHLPPPSHPEYPLQSSLLISVAHFHFSTQQILHSCQLHMLKHACNWALSPLHIYSLLTIAVKFNSIHICNLISAFIISHLPKSCSRPPHHLSIIKTPLEITALLTLRKRSPSASRIDLWIPISQISHLVPFTNT